MFLGTGNHNGPVVSTQLSGGGGGGGTVIVHWTTDASQAVENMAVAEGYTPKSIDTVLAERCIRQAKEEGRALDIVGITNAVENGHECVLTKLYANDAKLVAAIQELQHLS